MRGQALVFEEAGYSLLGPLALNCSAPDEGNMHLLEAVASPAQQERYLRPLAAGDVRSAFAMTEPAPGAGSDPTMLLTTARRDGDGLGDRRAQAPDHRRATAARSTSAWRAPPTRSATTRARRCCSCRPTHPGVRVERLIPTMDRAFSGGHAVVAFERLPRARRRRARRGRARLPLRAGAPRARAPDALHALARARAAGARHRARPAPASARPSARRCSSRAWCRRWSPTR